MATTPLLYARAERKGRELMRRLAERLEDQDAEDVTCDPIDIYYNVDITGPLKSSEFLTLIVNESLEYQGVMLEKWSLASVATLGSDDIAYCNYMQPEAGSIICADNAKNRDTNYPENRLQWSQMLFRSYEKVAAKMRVSVKDLKYIWRFYIANPETVKIMGIAQSTSGHNISGAGYTEFGVNDGGFYALIGSPNGSGVARMLTDHAEILGKKTIESVRILKRADPGTMYFVLSEHQSQITPKIKISKAKQKRLLKRSEGGGDKGIRTEG